MTDHDPILAALADALRQLAPGLDAEASAKAIAGLLAERDVNLMHWPERRAPARMSLLSKTPAGPIRFEGADLDGMGVRMTVGAELTGAAIILNLPYADAMMLGAWLLARALKGTQRAQAKAEAASECAHA